MHGLPLRLNRGRDRPGWRARLCPCPANHTGLHCRQSRLTYHQAHHYKKAGRKHLPAFVIIRLKSVYPGKPHKMHLSPFRVFPRPPETLGPLNPFHIEIAQLKATGPSPLGPQIYKITKIYNYCYNYKKVLFALFKKML